MKILLITTDLYKSIGGGQTVYKNIIEATPDVQFFYFRDSEREDAKRPLNALSIPLAKFYGIRINMPPPIFLHSHHALIEANRFAASVAGQTFDIVDIPDFYTWGSVLRDAFFHHHVKIGRVVLSMHGNISDSIDFNWGSSGNKVLHLRVLEQAQFESADGVYSISPRYKREWQSRIKREVTSIDPAYFVKAEIKTAESINAKPSIYCIGRTERRKGNDLFIELTRWLKRDTFDCVSHIGDSDCNLQGIASSDLLENIANARGIKIESRSAMDSEQLSQLFAKRSIVVLPVRYDTLNLIALEALFSGCPVAISTAAGVCDYLNEQHPGLPYVKIDFNNFYAAVADIQDLIDNYDMHRKAILAYLAEHSPVPKEPLNMKMVYQTILDAPLRNENHQVIEYKEYANLLKSKLASIAHQILPIHTYRVLRAIKFTPRRRLINMLKKTEYFGDAKFFGVLLEARSIRARLNKIATHPEYSMGCLREKLDEIYGNASSSLYRCNFWMDIARIERISGNELMAVTYELRVLRLMGEDRLRLLPNVISTLNKHGFIHEAKAVQAMYTEPEKAEENVYAYLKEAYQRNLIRPGKPFQVLEDLRDEKSVKVAVIVSLYNAANKLNVFLTALSEQTLVKQGEVEIILVDSGSPTNEHEVIKAFLQKLPLNAVYAKSAERETIQSAWNRGIGLAKAPYLVFLGVDETLYPEAMEILADELDQNVEIDWVMANSLVTEVEEAGVYKHDVMSYNRDGASKDHVYLETCYLSWVGGMYRKTLHERFGYYDETFGAAGDTEIKNRVMPYINVKFIPNILGLFLNYPDGQTTASPKAEIEDLRAWYLHRTPGGVRYAFENRPLADAEKLMCTALGYRKSYCGHMSCDIEYASYLAGYIKTRTPDSMVANDVLPGLEQLLNQLRGLEFAKEPPTRLGSINALFGAWRSASQYQTQHREALKSISWPCYNVLNDNRYEQHSWLWKSV